MKYDIIIIGGGATGSGIALDSASRGYKTLLLEKNDFSEGTSSRSTKLVHGGVRYLEAAIKDFNFSQFKLVKEGLKERARLLNNAPHLASRLTLVTPIYKWWQLPYVFIGLFIYDFISGNRGLGKSSIISKKKIIDNFPNIKKVGLIGGVKYYDGTFNDSRLNITLVKTAQKYGAECRNHSEIVGFLYENEKISGVRVRDNITGKTYTEKSKIVINATGVFSDNIRILDDKEAKNMLDLSSGIHIVLDKKYLPLDEGLMIPKTEDGRVLFILPWMDKCLVGTTDEKTTLSEHPKVLEKDIKYILKHLDKYFDLKIDENEILSSWCGIRPLIKTENIDSTKSIVREHIILSSNSGLVSILGGKWTTYRKMSEEVVDYIIKKFDLENINCKTKELKLVGYEEFTLDAKYNCVDEDIKKYLINMYGSRAVDILNSVEKIERLYKDYVYTNAELIYTIKKEFVQKPMDFIVRRTSLALIDKKISKEILDRVLTIMQKQLDWDEQKMLDERDMALELLNNSI